MEKTEISKNKSYFSNPIIALAALAAAPFLLILLLCGFCESTKKGYKRGKNRRCYYW